MEFNLSKLYPEAVEVTGNVTNVRHLKDVVKEVLTFLMTEHDLTEIRVSISSDAKRIAYVCDDVESSMERSDFLSRFCDCDVFISSSNKNVGLKTGANNPNTIFASHMKLLSSIPRTLSGWLSVDNLSEIDMEILKSLCEGNWEDAIQMIQKWVDDSGLLKQRWRKFAGDILSKTYEGRKRSLTTRISELRGELRSRQNQINDHLKEIRIIDQEIEDNSILLDNMKFENDDSEIEKMSEFISNLSGVHFEWSGDNLSVLLEQPLDQVDPVLAKTLVEERGDLLFKALWIDRSAQLFTYSTFGMDGLVVYLSSCEGKNLREYESIPHPHLVNYGCSGGYTESFTEIAQSGDFYGAVMTMISCARNFNLGDSTVRHEFFRNIYSYKEKCCLYKGDWYSPIELKNKLESEASSDEKN